VNILPLALIIIGYVVLIWTAGWWGVAIAAVHIAVMVAATSFGGKRSPQASDVGHKAATRNRALRP
jgi:predicted PurR-regulated permease PerM